MLQSVHEELEEDLFSLFLSLSRFIFPKPFLSIKSSISARSSYLLPSSANQTFRSSIISLIPFATYFQVSNFSFQICSPRQSAQANTYCCRTYPIGEATPFKEYAVRSSLTRFQAIHHAWTSRRHPYTMWWRPLEGQTDPLDFVVRSSPRIRP